MLSLGQSTEAIAYPMPGGPFRDQGKCYLPVAASTRKPQSILP